MTTPKSLFPMELDAADAHDVELLRTFLPVLQAYADYGINPELDVAKALPSFTTIMRLIDGAYYDLQSDLRVPQ